MVVGYSFQMEDSYYLLFGDWDLGQTAKTAIQLMGYYNLFYVAIYYLYRALENEKIWRLNSNPDKFSSFIYSGKSWIKIFAIFMIVWLPYMIACYPGYIQGDTPDQLSQIFGMVGDSASYLNLLDESVTLNNHHPVLHTLLLGGCFRIGHFFGNDNMGIFIYTLIQYTLVCIALALGIAYLSKLKLPYWVRNSVLLFYLFVPIYVNFAVLTTKDVIYSVFLMWFMLFMLDLMLDRDVFYKNIKKMCCFFLILGGCVFMRHNGIYVLFISMPFIILVNKKHWKFVISSIIGIVVVYLVVGNIIYPALNITSGSRREALSVPLQQTGRYIYENYDEITDEEKAVLEKVIDVEACRYIYSPRLADPVKSTFNEDVTNSELADYFALWVKMFFKHPGCYFEAIIDNTYGYFYYGDAPAWKYTMTESENVQGLINPSGFNIHHLDSLHSLQTLFEEYEKLMTHFPVISILCSCAFFTWVLILAFMVMWRKNKLKYVFILMPAIVSLLVCVAGPLNGINDFRYMFPIAFILPFVVAVECRVIR
jgi:hypothetical protein